MNRIGKITKPLLRNQIKTLKRIGKKIITKYNKSTIKDDKLNNWSIKKEMTEKQLLMVIKFEEKNMENWAEVIPKKQLLTNYWNKK